MLKRIFLINLLFPLFLYASHNRGGEITYEHIGGLTARPSCPQHLDHFVRPLALFPYKLLNHIFLAVRRRASGGRIRIPLAPLGEQLELADMEDVMHPGLYGRDSPVIVPTILCDPDGTEISLPRGLVKNVA